MLFTNTDKLGKNKTCFIVSQIERDLQYSPSLESNHLRNLAVTSREIDGLLWLL